jgi:hypothetical protein
MKLFIEIYLAGAIIAFLIGFFLTLFDNMRIRAGKKEKTLFSYFIRNPWKWGFSFAIIWPIILLSFLSMLFDEINA